MRASLKIYFLIFIFLIFSTYSTNNDKKNSSILFPIKNIVIENNITINLVELKTDLNFLIDSSLFFLDEAKISQIMSKYEFISNIQFKKKYPNTLKVKLYEKTPLGIQIINNKKFYITEDNEKISFIDLKIYKDLPTIFGKNKNFNIFHNELKNNYFKVSEIKSFYFFDIGRWDIVLKSGKIIKLPEQNYLNLLPRINLMLEDSNFSKYNIFDFRIKDQLILQ